MQPFKFFRRPKRIKIQGQQHEFIDFLWIHHLWCLQKYLNFYNMLKDIFGRSYSLLSSDNSVEEDKGRLGLMRADGSKGLAVSVGRASNFHACWDCRMLSYFTASAHQRNQHQASSVPSTLYPLTPMPCCTRQDDACKVWSASGCLITAMPTFNVRASFSPAFF